MFTPNGSGTSVRLVHSAISNEQSRRGIGGGWEAAFGFLVDALGGSKNGRR